MIQKNKPMKLLYKYLLLFSAVVFYSNLSAQNLKITGKIKGNTYSKATLSQILHTESPTATATIDAQGNFVLQGTIGEPDFYWLFLSDKEALPLTLAPNQDIKLEIGTQPLQIIQVSGSDELSFLAQATAGDMAFRKQQDSIMSEYQKHPERLNEYQTELNRLETERAKYIESECLAHPEKLSCITLLEKLDFNEHFSVYDNVIAKLYDYYPYNIFVSRYQMMTQMSRGSAIGKPAPELSLADVSGKTVNLSSLKGKYVIVYFWMSFHQPCREFNTGLQQIVKKYEGKNLKVYAVTTDVQVDKWKEAIAQDKLTNWVNVRDPNGMFSPDGQKYGMLRPPVCFLIDENGIVIGRELDLNGLQRKLFETFQY